MKSVNVYVVLSGGLSFTTKYCFSVDLTKEEILESKRFSEKLSKDYPNAQTIEILIPTKSSISKAKLLEIGNEVASDWGGMCYKVTTYPKMVRFQCIEYGEKFDTYLTYDEIKQDYAYML